MLYKASEAYKYDLELAEISKIWRGGCIIRSMFLDDIYNAYQKNSSLEHLLTDESIQVSLKKNTLAIREIVAGAITSGFPIPAYASSLCYFDTLRSERMPSNLIQAQRDYFGAHTYELLGKEGAFHTDWSSSSKIVNTKN
jgi:6-phosphogluconate dehydrogenase